jgi:hypothetical protein
MIDANNEEQLFKNYEVVRVSFRKLFVRLWVRGPLVRFF